jgi:hypothetical protein
MKNAVFWDVTPCGSCKNRRFGELSVSFIRVTRIGELGTTLTVTRNRRTRPNAYQLQKSATEHSSTCKPHSHKPQEA